MPRNADRIVGHLVGQRGTTLNSLASGGSASISRAPSYRSSVYLYRPTSFRAVDAASGAAVPMSAYPERSVSTVRRIPITLTGRSFRRDSNNNNNGSRKPSLSLNPSRVSSFRRADPTTDGGLSPRLRMLATDEDFTDIGDNASTLAGGSRRVSLVEGSDGEVEILVDDDEPVFFTVFENIDGVRHLFSSNRFTRYSWTFLIGLFVIMCMYQIATQVLMYWFTPIATNIAASYPASVPFPVVAICNNNQFRLTYLTGPTIQRRVPKFRAGSSSEENATNVFDRVLLTTWDMDAMVFLRSAAHWRSRMILRCQWPNGTRCKSKDFRPVWTLNGLCWAINTDAIVPVHATGAGLGNALKLLLNVERYERIESCTPNFRTNSLPGLKILIYNQTDVPISNLEGVNVPPGFTMDIPFRMQRRQKMPGEECVDERWNADGTAPHPEHPENLHACPVRSHLNEIESRCKCTIRGAFFNATATDAATGKSPFSTLPPCNVIAYFSCAVRVLQRAYESGYRSAGCVPPCEHIDYTAWQDMNELPDNIFPKLIDTSVNEEYIGSLSGSGAMDVIASIAADDAVDWASSFNGDADSEHFRCELNQLLDDRQVERIKREACAAYERQARFQEDILLRTERLIGRLRAAAERLRQLKWGWLSADFVGVAERLRRDVFCYAQMPDVHAHVFVAVDNLATQTEERRALQIQTLLELRALHHHQQHHQQHDQPPPSAGPVEEVPPRSIADLRRTYGDVVEPLLRDLPRVEELLRKIHALFNDDNFKHRLSADLERIDRVFQLIGHYERGELQRRAWAEGMQSRGMRRLFTDDIYESWYNVVLRDLNDNLMKTIGQVEDALHDAQQQQQPLNASVHSAANSLVVTVSVLLFGDALPEHLRAVSHFLDETRWCLLNEVRNRTRSMLDEFRGAMLTFQSTYANLFEKELPEYLSNFEFGAKFVRENFAQVNVFLHKMNVEHWVQQPTYSIYSLFCDVGGSLGLFLNASLLTLIEIAYFVFDTQIYRRISRGGTFCGERNGGSPTHHPSSSRNNKGRGQNLAAAAATESRSPLPPTDNQTQRTSPTRCRSRSSSVLHQENLSLNDKHPCE